MLEKLKNLSIVTKILGIVVVFSIISEVFVSSIFFSEINKVQGMVSDSVTLQAEKNIHRVAESNARFSDEFLEKIGNLTTTFKKSIEYMLPYDTKDSTYVLPQSGDALSESERFYIFGESDAESNKELNAWRYIFPSSEKIYNFEDAVSAVYFGTESGCYYEYSNNVRVKFDPRERKWYKDAKLAYENSHKLENMTNASVDPIWQDVYEDIHDGNLCVTCSVPILDVHKSFVGVAAIDVRLDKLQGHLRNNHTFEKSVSFVLDKNNKIIMDDSDKVAEIDENALSDIVVDILRDQNAVNNTVNSNGYMVSLVPLKKTDWKFGIVLLKEEVLQPVLEIKSDIFKMMVNFLVVFSLFTSCTFVISFYFMNRTLRPIKKVRKNLKKIGEGDLEVVLPVESEDEIGKLCLAFNKMTKNLKEHIENLAKTTAEKERVRHELTIAKKIQHSLLPYTFPAFPDRKDVDIFAMMEPAKEVGGDFYDFFFIDDDNLAFAVADVSDKGISAALFMVIVKILLKNETLRGISPAEVLNSVNNKLCETNEAGMFVTLFLGIVNLKTGKFIFSNAGHNLPYIYKNQYEKFEMLPKEKTFVLAAEPNVKFMDNELILEKNDAVFVYSDGVTEAANLEKQLFSQERLTKLLNNKTLLKTQTAKDVIIKIYNEVDKFEGNAIRSDDITMLCLKIT